MLEGAIIASVTVMAVGAAAAAVRPLVPTLRRCVTRLWRGLGRAATSALALIRGERGTAVLRPPAYFEMAAAVPTPAVVGEDEKVELILPSYQENYAKEKENEDNEEKGDGGQVSGGGLMEGGAGGSGLVEVDMDIEESEFGSDLSERVPRGVWRDVWGSEGGLRREMDRTYTIEEETESEVEAERDDQVVVESPTDSYDSDDPVSSSPPSASFDQVICACVGAV